MPTQRGYLRGGGSLLLVKLYDNLLEWNSNQCVLYAAGVQKTVLTKLDALNRVTDREG